MIWTVYAGIYLFSLFTLLGSFLFYHNKELATDCFILFHFLFLATLALSLSI